MDSGCNGVNMCNGNNPSSVVVAKVGMDKGEGKAVDTSSLLSSALKKGGMKGWKQRSRRKKVQWNDCNGNKLVEVMEFQPSDSSDSEEEFMDAAIEKQKKILNRSVDENSIAAVPINLSFSYL